MKNIYKNHVKSGNACSVANVLFLIWKLSEFVLIDSFL